MRVFAGLCAIILCNNIIIVHNIAKYWIIFMIFTNRSFFMRVIACFKNKTDIN
jgi:hypothetical protein